VIGAGYVQTMARYNALQNRSLYTAADGIGEQGRRLDRGAYFGSIHGTLSHLVWGDQMWMSRFAGWQKPGIGIPESADWVPDWGELCRRRAEADAGIGTWAERLTDADLGGDLAWWSGVLECEVRKPRWLLVTHMFNHGTHHRGQVHAMLTASGARTEGTDLFLMEGAD
jgi:uncharacterized damage-inducible protein DinB